MEKHHIGAVSGNFLFVAQEVFVRVPPVCTSIDDLYIESAPLQRDLKKMRVRLIVIQTVPGSRGAAEAKNAQLPALLVGIKLRSAKSEIIDRKHFSLCEIFLEIAHATSLGGKKKDIENSEGKFFRSSVFSQHRSVLWMIHQKVGENCVAIFAAIGDKKKKAKDDLKKEKGGDERDQCSDDVAPQRCHRRGKKCREPKSAVDRKESADKLLDNELNCALHATHTNRPCACLKTATGKLIPPCTYSDL